MPRTVWIKLGEIDSDSQPGDYHTIKKNPVDGEIGCDCGAYRYFYAPSRHAPDEERTCKHIIKFEAENPETVAMDITSAEAWMNLWMTQKKTYHRRWSRAWFKSETAAKQQFSSEAAFITPYGDQWTVFIPVRS